MTKAVKLSAELEFQAQHDALTGLGNRRVLERALSEANENSASAPFSMALLDLDQFKIVNDTCGHEAGDKLLVDIAKLLLESVRTNDVAVRLGGDEFALLLYNCDKTNAFAVAEKIREAVEALVFHWQGDTFRVGTSIGLLTVTSPYPDAADVLRRADAACFAAKDAGRNRVYQAEDEDQTLAKTQGDMHWVKRIQQALENNEFTLYSQPIVPLQPATGRSRVEILLRLRDYDKKRLIPPGAFLPAVERYGLSGRLDRWVVSTLIKQIKTYVAEFNDERSYWVNLSGLSLSDPVFLEFLINQINQSGLSRGTLNFEVTETAVISNLLVAKDAMAKLQALGCKFALDDFGAGVSTFGYLRNLPIDFVKVDGSFVKDLESDEANRIFVKSVIDIVRVLEIGTVVEFVEDAATARLLT
ncbi:MAG: EAL domain-containing protein, partial [Congregibacter sp.]|nr:EAL domain-containing protein [Congregibacter sp.]